MPALEGGAALARGSRAPPRPHSVTRAPGPKGMQLRKDQRSGAAGAGVNGAHSRRHRVEVISELGSEPTPAHGLDPAIDG